MLLSVSKHAKATTTHNYLIRNTFSKCINNRFYYLSRIIPNFEKQKAIKRTNHHSDKSRKRLSNLKSIPSLKDFIHRSSVLTEYRSFLRNALCIVDDHSRLQVRSEIRDSFRKYSKETDSFAIKMAMKEGERKLVLLRNMILTNSNQSQRDIPHDGAPNTKESKIKDDRVEVLWPWQRKQNNLHTNYEKEE